jgi:predicted AAA+ superfamily ATPase
MIQLLQEIILDSQERSLFTGTPRRIKVTVMPQKATVMIGVRRCGKSTWMHQVLMQLISAGVNRDNILYLNFFDDRLSNLKTLGPDKVLEAYFLLYPGKRNNEKIFCFFDEIQAVTGWESFIDRILRTENCEVYITGSSANMLSKEIATQMRGRALSWELFPFSFREFLDNRQVQGDPPFSVGQRFEIQHAFETFWNGGGFPEVAGANKEMRIKIHQEYSSSILFRDLIERYDISHPRALIDLAHRLIDNAASLYTLNKLAGYLASLGHKVPKSTVADYLMWFEDAYFLFTVRMFDASYNKSNANPKKIYAIDHAFLNSLSSGILINSGHQLENMVFVALRRRGGQIWYYRTGRGNEVDFITIGSKGEKQLFQVSESLANPDTRNRELSALQGAMQELELKTGTVVTRNEEEQVTTGQGDIQVIPAWRFLLMDE